MKRDSVRLALFKLNQHRQKGTSSPLNIFEVAQLMDAIKFPDKNKELPFISSIGQISLN